MKLPGISSIFSVSLDSLPPYLRERSMTGEVILLLVGMDRIVVGPQANAVDSSENSAEGTETKSQLSFVCDVLPFDKSTGKMGFVIVDADNRTFLMGTKEPPFPVIKITDSSSHPVEGKAGIEVVAEWNSPLIPIKTVHRSSF